MTKEFSYLHSRIRSKYVEGSTQLSISFPHDELDVETKFGIIQRALLKHHSPTIQNVYREKQRLIIEFNSKVHDASWGELKEKLLNDTAYKNDMAAFLEVHKRACEKNILLEEHMKKLEMDILLKNATERNQLVEAPIPPPIPYRPVMQPFPAPNRAFLGYPSMPSLSTTTTTSTSHYESMALHPPFPIYSRNRMLLYKRPELAYLPTAPNLNFVRLPGQIPAVSVLSEKYAARVSFADALDSLSANEFTRNFAFQPMNHTNPMDYSKGYYYWKMKTDGFWQPNIIFNEFKKRQGNFSAFTINGKHNIKISYDNMMTFLRNEYGDESQKIGEFNFLRENLYIFSNPKSLHDLRLLRLQMNENAKQLGLGMIFTCFPNSIKIICEKDNLLRYYALIHTLPVGVVLREQTQATKVNKKRELAPDEIEQPGEKRQAKMAEEKQAHFMQAPVETSVSDLPQGTLVVDALTEFEIEEEEMRELFKLTDEEIQSLRHFGR